MTIVEEIMQQVPTLSKPVRKFLIDLWTALSASHGRATMENLSRYGAGSPRRIARHCRRNIDFIGINLLSLAVAGVFDRELVIAIDCTFLPKAGKRTYGVGKFYNSSASRAESGLEACVLSFVDLQEHTAYTLDAQQTPATIEGEENRTDFYLSVLTKAQPHFQKHTHIVVGDGNFANIKFIDGLEEQKLTLVSKLRHNADLRYLHNGPKTGKAGRPKKYDGKVDFSDLSKMEPISLPDPNVKGYTAIVNHKHFQKDIRVVVLVHEKNGKRTRKILFSTDTQMSGEKIVEIYGARFQIEFVFRDAKQHTGLGQAQVRDQAGQSFFHAYGANRTEHDESG